MTDWRQQINDIFQGQGYEKKIPELSPVDEAAIQEFMDNIGKPAFENFCDELNTFQHVKAEVIVQKKKPEALLESVELTVFKMSHPKLTYRLKFFKKEAGIFIGGEYSIPNIYGENTRFQDSTLGRPLTGTTEEEIANDFSGILKSKF